MQLRNGNRKINSQNFSVQPKKKKKRKMNELDHTDENFHRKIETTIERMWTARRKKHHTETGK